MAGESMTRKEKSLWIETFAALIVRSERGHCQGCGLPVSKRAYRVPNLAGVFCSILCIETELFRFDHCRWCGERINRPYTGIESRLCSGDCRENYFAHVFGDCTAELGSGKRLLLWLEHKQPFIYRQIISGATTPAGHCQNPQCPDGENGFTASLAYLRSGTLFCSDACRVQANRSPNRQKSASKNPVFIGVSRNTSDSLALPPCPDISAWKQPLDEHGVG